VKQVANDIARAGPACQEEKTFYARQLQSGQLIRGPF
jgi:hypothetical protein